MDICYLCQKELNKFMTTPILETPYKKLQQICEECANINFPGWNDDEEEE